MVVAALAAFACIGEGVRIQIASMRPPPRDRHLAEVCRAANDLATDGAMEWSHALESPEGIEPFLLLFYDRVHAELVPAARSLCGDGTRARPQVTAIARARYCAAAAGVVHRAATVSMSYERRDTFEMTIDELTTASVPLCRL